ncbi:MAG TPA: DUF1304 domain-containing protein [Cryptosporangiaceae bacterium]|nr:DUF1304 domain-containing protein [Cryptosporangiaceae bacterium]
MELVSEVLVGIIAALHVWFLVLEMFLWQKPLGLKTFGLSAEDAAVSATLAKNQGLYNGFLAAGLVCGVIAADPVGFGFKVFFLACVLLAGLYGGFTVSRRILVVQALPAAVALALVLAARV